MKGKKTVQRIRNSVRLLLGAGTLSIGLILFPFDSLAMEEKAGSEGTVSEIQLLDKTSGQPPTEVLQVVSRPYEIGQETKVDGTEEWYLCDMIEGLRYSIPKLLEAAREYGTLVTRVDQQKVTIIVMAVVIGILVLGITFMNILMLFILLSDILRRRSTDSQKKSFRQ